MINIKPLIQSYISLWDDINCQEQYKWDAIKYFQDTFFADDSPISIRTIKSLSKHVNLLDSQKYFPFSMLSEVSQEKQSVTDVLLTNLFDESRPLKDRIITFMSEFVKVVRIMADEGYSDWKGRGNLQTFQDTHAVSVYLALRYPKKHYIYKFGIFKDFAKIVGYNRKETGNVDRLMEFYSVCEMVKEEILKENEFIACYNSWMKSHDYEDSNYNLLTQDFIYAVARYLNSDVYTKTDKKKTIVVSEPRVIQTSEFYGFENKVSCEFKSVKGVDYVQKDKLYSTIGLLGEIWVMNYEKERLSKLGILHKVIHSSVIKGDGLGYDIESVEDDGVTPRYIEVKTTTGGVIQQFYYTDRELEWSKDHSEHYYVYRVYDFVNAKKQANLLIIKGCLNDLNGIPVQYKVCAKP